VTLRKGHGFPQVFALFLHVPLPASVVLSGGLARQVTIASYKKSGAPIVISLKCRPIRELLPPATHHVWLFLHLGGFPSCHCSQELLLHPFPSRIVLCLLFSSNTDVKMATFVLAGGKSGDLDHFVADATVCPCLGPRISPADTLSIFFLASYMSLHAAISSVGPVFLSNEMHLPDMHMHISVHTGHDAVSRNIR
jgi:hypothetical protein